MIPLPVTPPADRPSDPADVNPNAAARPSAATPVPPSEGAHEFRPTFPTPLAKVRYFAAKGGTLAAGEGRVLLAEIGRLEERTAVLEYLLESGRLRRAHGDAWHLTAGGTIRRFDTLDEVTAALAGSEEIAPAAAG